jgi:uncharacterized protein (TIGR02246 family)
MKRISLIRSTLPLALACALGSGGSSARAAASDPQEAVIIKTAEAFVEAFQKGDAKAVAAFWTPDGDYVDLTGRVLNGRPAIEKDFATLFAENKGLKLRIEMASLKFPTPDTAVEDGTTAVLAPDGTAPSRARYSNFFVNKDGQWLLASVREAAYVPPSNYENLRGLEWVIGDWVDENPGAELARVSFAWSTDQNFIVSTRTVETKDGTLDRGTQWIGWDPVNKQIRSWNFEAGSHSGSGNYGYGGSTYHGTTSGGASYHGAYSTGGYGAYRYGGSYGGGGFHAAAVSGPNGTAYAAGVYRRRVW